MLLDRPATVAIRTLRVGGVRDPLALRLDVQRALAGARLAPAAVPDTAILCVRRVRATVPRREGQGEAARAALQAALAEHARGAARPARDAVPAQAEAVFFADRAELLACLARDWCAGRAGERWWWRPLLSGGGSIAAAVHASWQATPEYVPAALDQLASTGDAVPFVASLGDDTAHALLRAVIERFALPALRPLLDLAGRSTGPTGRAAAEGQATGPLGIAAPWLPWAPEGASGQLSAGQQALLGIGLMLHRAPGPPRAPAFARAVAHWVQTHERTPAATGTLPHDTPEQSRATSPQPPGPTPSTPEMWRPEPRPHRDGASLPTPAPVHNSAMPVAPMAHADEPSPPQVPTGQEDAATLPTLVIDPGATAMLTGIPEEAVPEFDRLQFGARIDTALGGLFYLLNLALALELYGDFTMPAYAGIDLPVWDFLALLGEELLGSPLHNDPLWPLLTGLAGRSSDCSPGHDFAPPGDWRMPPDWLVPFPAPGNVRWSLAGERLRVAHPAGFLVLDIAPGDVPGQLRAELAVYGLVPAERPDESPPAALSGPLARWLGWLMPYVRARLRRALDQDDDRAVAGLVCAHRARVRVSTARLDIDLSLADLPIAIRLAGLDRDPGWIPAAGRSVAFHFE